MRCSRVWAMVMGCAIWTSAQATRSEGLLDFPAFKVIQGSVDSDGLPTSGAKICLTGTVAGCFQMPSNDGYSKGDVVYHYGLDPQAERLSLKHGGSLVFFSAQFSGGGSGTLDSLAILKYEGGGKIVNLLPFVGVSNQGERATWSIPGASGFPLLLTADADWQLPAETHFAKHFFWVSAYRFDALKDRYVKVFQYRTLRKYPSLDEVDKIRVLDPERHEIVRRFSVTPASN